MLRYLTAGESHGRSLMAILEGMPSGLRVDKTTIDRELKRRQAGYGRGKRMNIEKDRVQILSGMRGGETLGSPVALSIPNKDWENWKLIMDTFGPSKGEKVTRPRPGHADLVGALKYDQDDIRNVLERASARETAARVAIGAIVKVLLSEFGISIVSQVIQIGGVKAKVEGLKISEIKRKASGSKVSCPDREAERLMIEEIDKAKKDGDTLGGIFEVITTGLPIGLGSYVHPDRRLDGRLAQGLMSIPAVKGVEIGLGFRVSELPGSEVQDEIFYEQKKGFYRKTNNAGGLEGGVTNGEPLRIKVALKPISTLQRPLSSVDLITKKRVKATVERADVCVVPAAAVIGESVVAFELANALIEKFGGDSISEMQRNYRGYLKYLKQR
ncbi:chorismate synthase [bacterium]|nr:chorismate synthase [bacterium]MBU4560841.1 chorismate synthase [bacterium]MCG2676686.1 chorismate synthase [bacterium]MCG2678168.1 chorismate synthase [bacterium]